MKLFWMTTFMLIVIGVQAQSFKGKSFFGASSDLSVIYQKNKVMMNNEEIAGLQLSPRYGYFLYERLVLGGSFSFTYYHEQVNLYNFQIGPFLRSYFTESKFRPFIFCETGYIFETRYGRYPYTINGIGVAAGFGFSYFINEHFFFDSNMGFAYSSFFNNDGNLMTSSANIGINILF